MYSVLGQNALFEDNGKSLQTLSRPIFPLVRNTFDNNEESNKGEML